MRNLQIPVACSISASDAAVQALEWAELRGHAHTAERIDGGMAITFPVGMAEKVMDLAAREAECCGFLSITTRLTDRVVRLEITFDDPGHGPMIAGFVEMVCGQ